MGKDHKVGNFICDRYSNNCQLPFIFQRKSMEGTHDLYFIVFHIMDLDLQRYYISYIHDSNFLNEILLGSVSSQNSCYF